MLPTGKLTAAPPPEKQAATLPPRRGRVKAQIFESLAGSLSSAAAKTGRALAKINWIPSTPPPSAATSTSASPPPSAYASDGYPDQA